MSILIRKLIFTLMLVPMSTNSYAALYYYCEIDDLVLSFCEKNYSGYAVITYNNIVDNGRNFFKIDSRDFSYELSNAGFFLEAELKDRGGFSRFNAYFSKGKPDDKALAILILWDSFYSTKKTIEFSCNISTCGPWIAAK